MEGLGAGGEGQDCVRERKRERGVEKEVLGLRWDENIIRLDL